MARLRLRMLAATVSAYAVGFARTVAGRRESMTELREGDVAPDFELPGSDGATYRLRDFAGKTAVVVAWFPKAFTGGWKAAVESPRAIGECPRRGGLERCVVGGA